MNRIFTFILVVALALTGCAEQDPLEANNQADGTLVVGSADFAESELLMNIYAEALRETGVDVQTRPRIGAREFYVDAVREGELAIVPDYTGNLLEYLEPRSEATASQPVYEELTRALPPNTRLLAQSPAENSDVLTVTRETAAATGIRSMADLGPNCADLVLGAPAEWESRWANKIANEYDCRFADIRGVESASVTVDALAEDQIQVANLFSTSAQIEEHDLVELDDPKNMYPAQNVVPLVQRDALNQRQEAALDAVSAALSTAKLTELSHRLEVEKANPADLAKELLADIRR